MNPPRLFPLKNGFMNQVRSEMRANIRNAILLLLLLPITPWLFEWVCWLLEDHTILSGLYVIYFVFIGLFSFWGYYNFLILKTIPDLAMMVDDDGIWPVSRSKESALVPWSMIREIREHFMQGLDILDASGQILLKLDYQLVDFETLHKIVREKLSHANFSLPALPLKFYVRLVLDLRLLLWLVLIVNLLPMMIFTLILIKAMVTTIMEVDLMNLISSVMVLIFIYVFGSPVVFILVALLNIPYKLVLGLNALEFHSLLSTKRYPYHKIEQVRFIVRDIPIFINDTPSPWRQDCGLEIVIQGEETPVVLTDGSFKIDLNYLCPILRQLAERSRSSEGVKKRRFRA